MYSNYNDAVKTDSAAYTGWPKKWVTTKVWNNSYQIALKQVLKKAS